jgi:uncharacterized protein
MESTVNTDLEQVAREAGLPSDKVRAAIELLDDGNTVPFITRFRRDQTGGLDEEQIRRVQVTVAKLRALADRKQRILRSLQAQGKLSDDLLARIHAADSLGVIEDLYLPFKPKKQTLAGMARSRGLEPLAREVLDAAPAAASLEARAAAFVDADRGLPSVSEVLQGAGHLIAEWFSENLNVRDELRKIVYSSAKLVTSRIEGAPEAAESEETEEQPAETEEHAADAAEQEAGTEQQTLGTEEQLAGIGEQAAETEEQAVETEAESDEPTAAETVPVEAIPVSDQDAAAVPPVAIPAPTAEPEPSVEQVPVAATSVQEAADESADSRPAEPTAPVGEPPAAGEPAVVATAGSDAASPQAATDQPPVPEGQPRSAGPGRGVPVRAETGLAAFRNRAALRKMAAESRREAKKRKRERKIESFKDYFRHEEHLTKIPPHRLLAINRGERSKILRVRISANAEAIQAKAEQMLVRPDHPHAEFLRGCVRDSLNRLVMPSLDREIRRQMTETAEAHAVHVFARNLRKLLLQPPVPKRRVLAIDPGFRTGCKLAALDEFGGVLGHTVIHVIGKEDIVRRGRQQIVEMLTMYHIPIIAIGNGTACRETELLIADVLANELRDFDVQYVMVNEAGASVYSTSATAREELPRFDPVLRSAVSIGRRLQDPLSELVKINPANIGVGLYQHDVKSKHLEEMLDAVVESCVNYVGVDVNTASPALLRYVSGLNQLTARRLYEYRQRHGPFRNRDQFKQVPGIGEATFVQAAGFLRIPGGDNPLDATWIHPESYPTALRVIERLGGNVAELTASIESLANAAAKPEPIRRFGAGVAHDAAGVEGAEQTPPSTDETPPGAEQVAPVGEQVPPVAEQVPPVAEQVPPVAEQVPPVAEQVPPVAEQLPPVAEQVPESREPPSAEHPASADAAAAPSSVASAPAAGATALAERAAAVDVASLARDLGVGELLLKDILRSLTRPGRDPREDLPAPAFRREVMKLEDLRPGMELNGTVLNVVDFGAFVDIGLPDSGLIHISRLADRFIRDPHEVVSVGDIMTVWVVEVDHQRRRVSLSAIKPGTERPPEQRRERPPPQQPRREDKRRRPEGRPPQGGRPGGGRPQEQRPRQGKPKFTRPPQQRPPARPITQAMVDGKEPMRSFSDLLQFYERKGDEDKNQGKKKAKDQS